MKLLKSLYENLNNARYDRQQVDFLIMDYLLSEDDHSAFSFVSGIKKLRTFILIRMIDIYLEETYHPTIEEVIKENKFLVFEFNDVTYRFSATFEGSPIFTKLSSPEAIIPPFSLQDRVKRCF